MALVHDHVLLPPRLRLFKLRHLFLREKVWISGSSKGSLPAAAQAIYANDGATTQLGISLAGIGGTPASAASEAFDEALTKQQVLAIVRPFIASGDLPS